MGRPLAFGGGALGLLGLVLSLLLGGDPSQAPSSAGRDQDQGYGGSGPAAGTTDPREDRAKDFVSVILADTEDTWPALLQPMGVRYRPPHLVLFSDAVESACGYAQAAVGPFYCPGDQQVYLDLSFFDELSQRFGAEGDFAQAYVVAHEIGHHVQKLLGLSDRVHQLQQRSSRTGANALSVRLELQADCFAGVWAHHANKQRKLLEAGDVEEGLRAAAAIGDDTLQKRAQGRVVPESFTHGSSAQRVTWFRRGLETGQVKACDTFDDQAQDEAQ
ncbi:neutral zinc metallopeptidase [Aggregicoccus sp. 17bor-14]|uniref:KPN_02809 family neutral zinc metallopeptidase n=1 Tax=Myxococcaceae TaxID=31 RepID=UPI00351A1DAB